MNKKIIFWGIAAAAILAAAIFAVNILINQETSCRAPESGSGIEKQAPAAEDLSDREDKMSAEQAEEPEREALINSSEPLLN